jgi:hypothetical protein
MGTEFLRGNGVTGVLAGVNVMGMMGKLRGKKGWSLKAFKFRIEDVCCLAVAISAYVVTVTGLFGPYVASRLAVFDDMRAQGSQTVRLQSR